MCTTVWFIWLCVRCFFVICLFFVRSHFYYRCSSCVFSHFWFCIWFSDQCNVVFCVCIIFCIMDRVFDLQIEIEILKQCIFGNRCHCILLLKTQFIGMKSSLSRDMFVCPCFSANFPSFFSCPTRFLDFLVLFVSPYWSMVSFFNIKHEIRSLKFSHVHHVLSTTER